MFSKNSLTLLKNSIFSLGVTLWVSGTAWATLLKKDIVKEQGNESYSFVDKVVKRPKNYQLTFWQFPTRTQLCMYKHSTLKGVKKMKNKINNYPAHQIYNINFFIKKITTISDYFI